MESPPQLPEATATPLPSRHRSKLKPFLIAAGALLLAILLFLVLATPSDKGVTWLTPAQVDQAMNPKPAFPRLRQFARTWIGPLYHKLRGTPPNVQVSHTSYSLPPNAMDPASLGVPVATNAAGLRAWVLSQSEWNRIRLALPDAGRNANGSISYFASTVIAPSGRPAQLHQGQSVPTSINAAGSPIYVPIGMSIELIPTVSAGAIKLLIGARLTEIDGARSTNGIVIKTNFAAACRITVPQGSALLLLDRDPKVPAGQDYWLLIVPVVLDAQGKPIKP